MDLTETIAPRSDQINADDLISGPRTFTIEKVTAGNPEQPVDVHLVEFPGRPFKPSKSMRRVMVAAWGAEASAYTGRRLTLYRDPEITFGRDKVGGIRISAMSHIDKRLTLALTVTRGKRAAYNVDPLPNTPTTAARATMPPEAIKGEQFTALMAALTRAGLDDRDDALATLREITGRDVRGPGELTTDEAQTVIDTLNAVTAGGAA